MSQQSGGQHRLDSSSFTRNIGHPIYLNAYIGCPMYRVSNMSAECDSKVRPSEDVENLKEKPTCGNLPASPIVCSEYGNPEKWIV